MRRTLCRVVLDDAGQDLIEYALLASLIAVVSISALQTLGPLIAKWFAQVNAAL